MEPFLRDPTVQWDRQGKSIQFGHLGGGGSVTTVGGGGGSRGGGNNMGGNGGSLLGVTAGDSRPQALTIVDERLMGIYNLKVNALPNRSGLTANRPSRKPRNDPP